MVFPEMFRRQRPLDRTGVATMELHLGQSHLPGDLRMAGMPHSLHDVPLLVGQPGHPICDIDGEGNFLVQCGTAVRDDVGDCQGITVFVLIHYSVDGNAPAPPDCFTDR